MYEANGCSIALGRSQKVTIGVFRVAGASHLVAINYK